MCAHALPLRHFSAIISRMHSKINKKVLVSGAEYFDDGFAINAYMDDKVPVDVKKAIEEHRLIVAAYEEAGIEVVKVSPPEGCQDGIYTANWGLVVGNKAVLSNLPNKRKGEEPHAEKALRDLGKDIVRLPAALRFSGQGDCLPCGNYLFVGSDYRTDHAVWPLLARETGLHVVGLRTLPQTDEHGSTIINAVTGWPDSFFYDVDLALAVITPTLIAWCPAAFDAESQARIRAIEDLEKIEVSQEEAMHGFACNLISTGETVVMSDRAPELKSALELRGLKVLTPHVTELLKGGGFIRCVSLTL